MADDPDLEEDSPRREVVVPMDLYKPIIVFSTLFAILCVVVGMMALDHAAASSETTSGLLLGIGGLLSIVIGAGTYAFSTRFRAPEMGNPKDDGDKGSDDG